MKKLLLSFFLIMGLLTLTSNVFLNQEKITPIKITVEELTPDLEKIIFENNDVKVSVFKKVILDSKNGTHHERVTFKYENKSNAVIKLKFRKLNVYDITSSRGEGVERTIQLESKSIKEYSKMNRGKSYYSFSRDLNGSIKATLDYIILDKIVLS